MPEFMEWFADQVTRTPMHFELYYSKIIDWHIHIWRKGTGDNDEDEEIINYQDIDPSLLLAKAEVAVKEYLLEKNSGY